MCVEYVQLNINTNFHANDVVNYSQALVSPGTSQYDDTLSIGSK